MNCKLSIITFLRALNLSLQSTLILFILSSSAGAIEINWSNSSGGTFQDATNWAGSVPGGDDSAIFNTGGNTYTVDMAADQTNYRMEVRSDDVTLDLNGGTHTITQNWSRAYVGREAGDNAALTLTDGTADYTREVSVGVNAGASGMLRVDNATLKTDSFKIGDNGTGTAIIENGGQVNINYNTQGRVWIGLGDDSIGNLTVTGSGSRLYGTGGYLVDAWNLPEAEGPLITVGATASSRGSLTIENGGAVDGAMLMIGEGTVLVDGENSRLTLTAAAGIGANTEGRFTVTNSGDFSGTALSIGTSSLTGEMSLSRDGTAAIDKLSMSGLAAGLDITERGRMSVSGDATIADEDGSDHATVNIKGEGSRLDIGNNLLLGGQVFSFPGHGDFALPGGTADMNVEDKGRVSVANTLQLFDQATINLNNPVSGLVTVGDVSPFLTELADDSGLVLVGTGGTLAGTGTINGHVFNLGGTVGPGFSPGTMSINGDFHLGSGGSLDLEIGGLAAGLYDQLLVNGDVVLDGTLNLIFIDDFLPELDDLLTDLITFDELTLGSNFNLMFSGLNNDWQYETLFGASSFGLRSLSDASAPVPEPSTLLLLSSGLISLACYTRKRKKRGSAIKMKDETGLPHP